MYRKILLVLMALVCAAGVGAREFADGLADSTMRINATLINHGQRTITIAPKAKLPRWYGRRVNLSTLHYPSNMTMVLTDAATGDTIFIDSKYLPVDRYTPDSPLVTPVILPLPKRDAVLTLSTKGTGKHSFPITRAMLDTLQVRGQTPANPTVTIREALDPKHAVYLAIVAEGYTPEEMPKFLERANQLDSALMSHPAFGRYRERFTITAVCIPSAESGVSRPSKGQVVNTPLGSHFDSYSLDRLLTIPDIMPLWDALEGAPADHVIVLANTDNYGGSGPYHDYCIGAADDYWAFQVIVHEFAHTFARLADEYEAGYTIYYSPDQEPCEPNITTKADFSKKWQHLIDRGEAGLYEGAGYQSTGVWRGAETCLMRAVGDLYFCPVCTDAIQRTIRFYTEESDQ